MNTRLLPRRLDLAVSFRCKMRTFIVIFCSLLVRKFNLRLCRLKVDGNRHILKIELDLEEVLDFRVSDPDAQSSSKLPYLEALVGIYDPSCGPTRVDTP